MSVDIDRLAADVEARVRALPRARERNGEIAFPCPLSNRHQNGDAHPSASYSIEKRAYCCQGCGASGGLVKGEHPMVRLLGIDADAYRANGAALRQRSGRPDQSWEIRDRAGVVVALHQRRNLSSGEKDVWWETPEGVRKLGRKLDTLPLYGVDRLDEREPGDDAPVVVCEGEPATDALLELGLRAVGTVTGANSLPSAEVLDSLRGADVVLWPDADDPGRAHMARLADRLDGIAASVRVFEPGDAGEKDDAANWVATRGGIQNLGTVLLGEIEEKARSAEPARPEFSALVDDVGYRLTIPALAAQLEISHLRRERYQLRGEVLTRCALPGAKSFDGVLSVSDVNLSSSRSRSEHARHLAEQARTTDIEPWRDSLEELAQRTLAAEREGDPGIDLRCVVPDPARFADVEGLRIPLRHPSLAFGDGDALKSMLALYTLGRLAAQGLRVGYVDWELDQQDHASRLRQLFPSDTPLVNYLRCEGPIGFEAQRIRRWARRHQIDYLAVDSAAYACGGAPESAEIAMGFFSSVRQLGERGSFILAHQTKAHEGNDKKPFGSVFWFNSARAVWHVRREEREPGTHVSHIAISPRKNNLGRFPDPTGLRFAFHGDRCDVQRVEVGSVPDLAASLPVKQRMLAALRAGGLSANDLAEEVDTSAQTVRSMVRRHASHFRLENGVIHLIERRVTS